jgi:hypothetical protein
MNDNPIIYILKSLVLGKFPLNGNLIDAKLTLHMLGIKNKRDKKFLSRVQYFFDKTI